MDLNPTIGSKKCSLPLFHSEILHSTSGVVNLILPKNISDVSQKRPIGLLILNILSIIMAIVTFSAISGSMRIGLFVVKTNSQCLESMLASFRRVTCLFTIYFSGIRTGKSHIGWRTTQLEMSLMFGSLVAV